MALTVAEHPSPIKERPLKQILAKRRKAAMAPSLPDSIITPAGDPWPRPYTFSNGLRRVEPYHYTYNTSCKQRWRGRPLLEIFADEFRDRPAEYYEAAILSGKVRLNGKDISDPQTIVKNGDLVSHTLHRHEPPVTAESIGIVYESDDMLVINKPASIPVHPAGRYNFNSVNEILQAERMYGFRALPCNRLDRLTSGIMFIAKHPVAAERMRQQLTSRTVRKEYVARVRGEFPPGEVVCDQPVLQISPKLGLNRVRANGKSARTVFERLAYWPPSDGSSESDRGSSIVVARPQTGRTHQIRVHLQFLGHPIANDPIYANARVFGPDLGAFCSSPDNDDSILDRLNKMGKSEAAEAVAWHDEQVEDFQRRRAEKLSGEKCNVCGTELYTDPGPHEMGIWLHARRYEDAGGRWAYETGLPAWAIREGEREGVDATEVVVKEAKAEGDLVKVAEEELGLNKADGEVEAAAA